MSLVAVSARRNLCDLDALGVHDRRRRVRGFAVALALGHTQGLENQKPESLLRRNFRKW
jgi:hypothetical protein